MFLTQHEIAQSRNYTLNNLLGISSACLDAGQRLSALFSNGSRDALMASSQHWAQFGHGQLDALSHFPARLWLEHGSRASKLLGSAYEIIGETHKMLIHGAEAQIRVLDEMTLSSLDRLARNSPWEATIAIDAVRNGLQTAEQNLHEISAAAIDTVNQGEQEIRDLTEAPVEPRPTKTKPAARSRAKPN